MLNRMPVAILPRSFTLSEEPQRRFWDLFNTPNANWLRVATATAVVMLAFLLAGDFSGILRTDVAPMDNAPRISSVITQPAENNQSTSELPVNSSDSKTAATVPESVEAAPATSSDSQVGKSTSRIARAVDPIAKEVSTADAISAAEATEATDPSLQAPVVPNDVEALPGDSVEMSQTIGQGEESSKEISIWLRSLELVLALSIVLLGTITFQAWRKWRTFSTHD